MQADLRVFTVDDQVPFLKAAACVIAATDGFRLVGCATSAQSALDRLAEISSDVDVVLLDIELGDANGSDGLTVASQLLQKSRNLAVVILSMIDPDDMREELEASGALAFVPKAAFGPAALEALRPSIERHRLPWLE